MRNFFSAHHYQHLNKILINRSNLQSNFEALQSYHPEAEIAPVLKSNAYGHGLKTVAPVFDSLHPPFLIVDSLYEAYELQKLRLNTPILILGYTHPNNLSIKRLPFHFTVFDLETARTLNQKQIHCHVHIFIDTGMHREGIILSELPRFLQEFKKLNNLKLTGIASHFADADNPVDDSFTRFQLQQFMSGIELIRSYGFDPEWRHISASGGAFKIKDSSINLIRVGLACYGIHPLPKSDADRKNILLIPALSFNSTLAQIKTIKKGDKVGYNCTFVAKKEMKIGLLPAGYYDGVDRRLSNKGVVTIRQKLCQILGRVSMNMTVIDLDTCPMAQVGDEVTLYSNNVNASNSLEKVAEIAQTIPYEILVHLAESVKREVVE